MLFRSRTLVEQQIRSIDERLAAASAATPAAQQQSVAAGQAAVRVNITLSPKLTADAAAPLFVFVRAPEKAGPPLAAKRLESHFPQSVTLTPADSMIPGRAFAAGQTVQVIARIARSGSPVGASGDPDRKSTRLNSSHRSLSRMPSSA